MTAIITCGETRQSLCAARSLGRASIPVVIAASKRPCLAMWSRYATSTFLTKDPKKLAHAFAEHLAEELCGRYATMVLVGSDSAFWAISKYRELLPISVRRILPPHYSVVRSLDHEALHSFAESLGISCAPLIRVAENVDHQEVLTLVKKMRFPLLLRPIIPWFEREDENSSELSRTVVNSRSHLKALMNSGILSNGFLLSAYKSVTSLSYFGVAQKGEVLCHGTQERLSELAPYNEVATLAQTIKSVEQIEKPARVLLEALQWQGPFKVEFIKDEHGQYRLISLIGRLWGSLQLASRAGLDVPLICYRLAEGTLGPDVLKNAEPNFKMRWLVGDAASRLFSIRGIARTIFDITSFSSNKKRVQSLFSSDKVKTCYDVLDYDDPMPFLFELQHETWKRAFSDKDSG